MNNLTGLWKGRTSLYGKLRIYRIEESFKSLIIKCLDKGGSKAPLYLFPIMTSEKPHGSVSVEVKKSVKIAPKVWEAEIQERGKFWSTYHPIAINNIAKDLGLYNEC